MKNNFKINVLICILTSTCLILFGFHKADAAISFEGEQVFKTTLVNYTDIDSANSTTSYVVYNDSSGNGYAQYCFSTGNCYSEKSFGNSTETIPAIMMQVAALSTSSFVVVYRNTSTGNGIAQLANISRGVITFRTPVKFNTASTQFPHVAKLASNKIVVTYEHSDGDGYAIIGSVSGTTLSFPSAAVKYRDASFQANQNVVATLVDDSKFVVAWEDTPGNDGYARIGTVSGTTPSFSGGETDYPFELGAAQYMSIDRLNDDKFIVAYKNTNGYAVVGDVSGSSISYGNLYEFNDANTDYIDVAALDQYTFNIVYRDNGNSGYGTSRTGYVTNNVLSYGSEVIFNSGGSLYNSITYMLGTPQNFQVVYRDIGNSNYGTMNFGQEDALGGPSVPEFASLAIKIFIGMAGFMVVIFFGIYIKKKIIDPKKKK